MFRLEEIVRKNILDLKPYSSARDEFAKMEAVRSESVFLDANENPFGELNRYPDPYQRTLKEKLSELKGISQERIFIGNGSDEIIDLSFRIFCSPGVDQALTFSPTYGMYSVSAEVNNVELIEIPLNKNFEIDMSSVAPYLIDPLVKLIFICSPNNPTGNCLNVESIQNILSEFSGVVVLDEAYIDFASTPSRIEILDDYLNLIVVQTCSKALGLAAARIGIAYANEEVIALFNKVKPPYNVSTLNQRAAIKALSNINSFENNKAIILEQRTELKRALDKIECVKRVYPSEANFLLVEVGDADRLYTHLINTDVIVRNRNGVVGNSLRISVGTPEENKALIKAISTF